jgi:multiple sugar transport system permease protein
MGLKSILRSPLKREDFFTGLICLSPSVLVIAVFVIFPIFFSLYLSFHEWAILTPEKPFVGLANFERVFSSEEFWQALRNTFLYTIGVVPCGAAASLVLALLLNRTVKGSGFFRTAYFLPVITSTIAIAVVWLWLYDDTNGLLNLCLKAVGLKPVRWLTSTRTALLSVVIMTIWRNAGYHMVIFLAGLQSVPESLYEAAIIDGARPVQRFRYITWPLLVPTTVFVMITNTIFTFQVFGPIYVMTGGGPVRATSVIVYYLYQRAFEFQEMGYASAVAWLIFLILIGLTLFQLRLSRNKERIW